MGTKQKERRCWDGKTREVFANGKSMGKIDNLKSYCKAVMTQEVWIVLGVLGVEKCQGS